MRKVLNIIITILLVLICIAGHILIKELKSQIPELDYTIYDVTKKFTEQDISNDRSIIGTLFQKEEHKEYSYKLYKKMILVGVCPCMDCRRKWKWEPTPRFKYPIEGVTIAANPNILKPMSHIKSDNNEFTVHYIDDSIPTDIIYVYVENHNDIGKLWCSGIHDIYKAKED